VVIDTNVVVSSDLSPRGTAAQVLNCWREEGFDLLVSEPILEEYERVLRCDRVRRRHGLSDEEISQIVEDFRELAILVPIVPADALNAIEEDPADNMLLECAVVGGAECIVSGDEPVLALASYSGIQVLSPAAFLLAYSASGDSV